MPLNDIVNVVITRQTQTISEVGFGIPLILGTSNNFTDRIKFYSSIDEVALDFSSSDKEYIASQDIFSQDISPVQIAIGRRQVDEVNIAVETAMTGINYKVTINGTDASFTSITGVKEDIALGLVTAITALTGLPVTAIDNTDGTFKIVATVAGTPFTVKLSTNLVNVNSAIINVTQVIPNTEYLIRLGGAEFNYVSPLNIQSADQIVSQLVSKINATPQAILVNATNLNNGSFRVSSVDPLLGFSIYVTPEIMSTQKGLIQQPLIASNPVTDDLDAINDTNNSWYALISTDRDPIHVKAVADWVEARTKIFGTASNDPNIINQAVGTDTTSIAHLLNAGGYVRTFVMYHQDALTDFPEASWFGRVLPLDVGSETWKFKTLRGISYSNLTTTQSNNALNKKANTYEFVAGVGITANGTMAQGEFIDIVRGIDWLKARIQEFVFRVLVVNEKVPYTDSGIAVIQAEVMRVLEMGVSNNFLTNDPKPVCTVPRAITVPNADKANRILRNVKFTATLAGSIHSIEIKGLVSV